MDPSWVLNGMKFNQHQVIQSVTLVIPKRWRSLSLTPSKGSRELTIPKRSRLESPANWVIIWYLPPIKGTRKLHWNKGYIHCSFRWTTGPLTRAAGTWGKRPNSMPTMSRRWTDRRFWSPPFLSSFFFFWRNGDIFARYSPWGFWGCCLRNLDDGFLVEIRRNTSRKAWY